MIKSIKIPDERVPVLVGKGGKVKNHIERITRTKIMKGDEITIEGDVIDLISCENIVRAIGRGFDPKTAEELIDEENTLIIIQISDDKKVLNRLRGRLIGTGGRAKEKIELLTRTKLSIYGKTVSIIGRFEDAERAKDAVARLMSGSPHNKVYRILKKRRKK